MPTVTQHVAGMSCWSELATTDQPGAKKFYSSLFGWEPQDSDMGGGETYTMLRLQGREVGALYTMQKEQRSQGVPPNWLNYIAVENADRASEKAKQLGGQVLMGPMDVMEHGRMAVLQDPTGAVFAIWQAKQHPGAGVVGEPGSVVWTELYTNDTEKAKAFYTGLFGYTSETKDMGPPGTPMLYTVYSKDGTQASGMMQIQKEWGEVPPNWLTYFAVADCDATLAKAQQHGGKVTVPPMDIPNVGRFAILADPQGAMFAVIAMAPMKG